MLVVKWSRNFKLKTGPAGRTENYLEREEELNTAVKRDLGTQGTAQQDSGVGTRLGTLRITGCNVR